MANECYEVQVVDALIRPLAGSLHDIYLRFNIGMNVKLLAAIIGEDCGIRPVQLIHQILLNLCHIFMASVQILHIFKIFLRCVVLHPNDKRAPKYHWCLADHIFQISLLLLFKTINI
jgi:hypothetical protein